MIQNIFKNPEVAQRRDMLIQYYKSFDVITLGQTKIDSIYTKITITGCFH